MICWPSLNVCHAAHQVPWSLIRSLAAPASSSSVDSERDGQAAGDVERGLLLAAFVAVDLAQVDSGGGRESGLGEAGVLAEPTDDLAEVSGCVAGFHAPGHPTDGFVVDKLAN